MAIISGWFIPNGSFIAIKINLEDPFYNLYWTDEPIGHCISKDELINDKKEAIKRLIYIYNNSKKEGQIKTLSKWRENQIKFINSTHGKNILTQKDYKNKKRIDEWFNISDCEKILKEENK